MKNSSAILIGALSALAAYAFVLHPRLAWWGSTRDERRERAWPGDEVASARPYVESMRAITVDASVDRVWPWIEQLGDDPVQYRFLGDTVWLSEPRAHAGQSRLVVGYLQQNRAMVLVTPDDWERRILGKPIARGTWGFILHPAAQNKTHLIVRSVWSAGPLAPARLLNHFSDVRRFFTERRMLHQLKTLAERSRRFLS